MNKERLAKLEENVPKDTVLNRLKKLGDQWRGAIHSGNESKAIEAREKAGRIFENHPEYRKPASRMPRGLFMVWQGFISYPHRAKLTKELQKYTKAIHSGDRKQVLKSAEALENIWIKYSGKGFPTVAPIWYGKPLADGWFLLAQLPIAIRYAKADPDRWKKNVDQTLTEILESFEPA